MLERKISLEEAYQYAEEAKNHARKQILKGCTQLENNNLSETSFNFLDKGITGIRQVGKQKVKKKVSSNPLEKNPYLAYYESDISTTSKYSLGNCFELAVQALDYIINNVHSAINAEVYKINGGDHVFLVLNRDQDSNPQDPNTWGENAIICDPWADKVYKAADYLSELKNFYRSENKNHVEDFDPSRHLLVQYENLNTNFLRYTRSVANLKANFLDESKRVVKVLESYKDALSSEGKRIREKYGDSDQRILLISEKINLIDKSILSTRDFVNQCLKRKYKNDYRFARAELTKAVNLLYKNVVFATHFSQEEQVKLFEHKGQDTQTEIMKFFGIKSETQSHLEGLPENVREQLSKKSK